MESDPIIKIKSLLRVKEDSSWQESILKNFAKEEKKIIQIYRIGGLELSDSTIAYTAYQDLASIVRSFNLGRRLTTEEAQDYFKKALKILLIQQ